MTEIARPSLQEITRKHLQAWVRAGVVKADDAPAIERVIVSGGGGVGGEAGWVSFIRHWVEVENELWDMCEALVQSAP